MLSPINIIKYGMKMIRIEIIPDVRAGFLVDIRPWGSLIFIFLKCVLLIEGIIYDTITHYLPYTLTSCVREIV